MEIQVQPATAADAMDACHVIRRSIIECCHDDHRGDDAVLQGWLRNKTPEFVRRVIATPNTCAVVARVGGQLVGFGSVLASGEVTLLYVVPAVRFTGVGKALLAALEDHAIRTGVETLRVQSTRTARAFYLRNGFLAEGPPVLAFGMEALPLRKPLRSMG